MDCKNECEEIKALSTMQNDFIQSMKVILEKLDRSQLMVEGNAFDAINSTDSNLNLVKEGNITLDQLIHKITIMNQTVERAYEKMEELAQLSSLVSGLSKQVGTISNKVSGISRTALIAAAKEITTKDMLHNISNEMKELSMEASICSSEMDETVQAIQMYVQDTTSTVSSMFNMAVEENGMIEEVKVVFQKILDASHVANDVSRNMEHEIAFQRDITDNVVKAIEDISKKEKNK